MRTFVLAAVAAAALTMAPASALADGDPASDILLLQDAYLPYSPPVSGPMQKAVRQVLAETKTAGFPLKLAVIASQNDLGSVPQMFGRPQNYAQFLGNEIAFNAPKHLVVVMPAGYGVDKAGPAAAGAVAKLGPPAGSDPDSLARAGVNAVVAVAKAAGHPVAKPSLPGGGGGGGGSTPVVVFVVPVLLLALAGVLATVRRRREEEATEARP